jgi:HlyD family secretion protein
MESKAERKLAVEMAKIRLDLAQGQEQTIQAQGKAEIEVIAADRTKLTALTPGEKKAQSLKIDLLQQQLDLANDNQRRMSEAGPETIAGQDLKQQKLVVKQSETQLEEAQIALAQLTAKENSEKRVLAAREAAAQSKKQQALAELSIPLLKKRVAQAEEELEQSVVRAPTAGTILRVEAHRGDVVAGKPIIQMADADRMQVVAEIHESFYWRVKVGQRATIKSDVITGSGQKDGLKGRVTSRGSTFGQQQLFAVNPKVRQDERVFEVKIRIEDGKQAADLIGHQVDVTIDSSSKEDAAPGTR